mmetsp:Transcript_11469/g.21237  ORF Transcript_11469/g.21237 Transcript_11469/m.21237 type:complete len:124 (-) Transcript_11469:369-740(-)|eukprot:CAMPEP_0201884304 /NCGR_PEP_ID=MMETSP0902-20130614/16894_1 /ASSEMBLY_ACC=CAM_ASM_000551 /TAXON_ID=420261 /ORGANISM="Thalassiosira antarctica, Strain CCMP982" /LENGTH=123 /DNA_ID=CAMNT_0048413243 /DNA_START=106 /DNA_END=477 /DNA_ORIENTATION=+
MISRNALSSAILVICIAALTLTGSTTDAFTTPSIQSRVAFATTNKDSSTTTALSQFGGNQFGKKKPEEDLSFIESRDMTREEMLELNKRNEDVMNRELQAMTGVSVLFSIPIFYLCWVAFFSD